MDFVVLVFILTLLPLLAIRFGVAAFRLLNSNSPGRSIERH